MNATPLDRMVELFRLGGSLVATEESPDSTVLLFGDFFLEET